MDIFVLLVHFYITRNLHIGEDMVSTYIIRAAVTLRVIITKHKEKAYFMLPLQCGLGMSVFCEWYHPSILGELDLDVNSQLPKNASFIFSCYETLTRCVKITPST